MTPEEYEEWLKGKVTQFSQARKKPGRSPEVVKLFAAALLAYKNALEHFQKVGVPGQPQVTWIKRIKKQ